MKTPQQPHYHVACHDGGEVWTYDLRSEAMVVGRNLRRGGWKVHHYYCPGHLPCPDEIVYRWQTGRVPSAKYTWPVGRRRPKKSVAYDRRLQHDERVALLEGEAG